MSQNIRTLSEIEDDIVFQVKDSAPAAIIQILVGQMEISQQAKIRIEEEGIVVRNIGGLVISHPAIKIQNDAEKIIASLLAKYAAN